MANETNHDRGNAKRLHIAMVIDVYTPIRNGTVESTRRFTEALRERGHRVTIISTGRPEKDKICLPRITIPYYSKHVIRPMEMDFARTSKAALRRMLKGVDLLHVQIPFYLGWQAARFAKSERIPCIATHHLQAEFISNGGITWKPAVGFAYKLFIKTYNQAYRLICPSQMGIDDLKNYGYEGASTVISNGVSKVFSPKEIERPERYKDKFVILSVGRLATEKHHQVTIEGIAKSRYQGRIQFVLAGTGPQRKRLQALCEKLSNPVEFVFLSTEELVDYYNIADLLVHSAETEMEGMGCLEAIACGCVPLIADSPLSASTQFAVDDRSVYPFGDAEALAEKIDYWVEHTQERLSMKEQHSKHAQKFRFETSLDKLEDLYYEAIDNAYPST